jgi:hypothetical protein
MLLPAQPGLKLTLADIMIFQTRSLSWSVVWLALLLVPYLVGGCATTSPANIRLEPKPADGQTIAYQRGQPQIKAAGSNPVRLTVVDHAADQMVVHVSVENWGATEYLFSEQEVSGEMITPKGAQPLTFYSYQEVLEELDDSDEKLAAQAGSAAISVGSRVVPYGGTVGSIAKYVLAANAGEENDPEARLDSLTKAALDNAYIRRNTMTPGSRYEGILRVALPEPLNECQSLQFDVHVGAVRHRFAFDCRAEGG